MSVRTGTTMLALGVSGLLLASFPTRARADEPVDAGPTAVSERFVSSYDIEDRIAEAHREHKSAFDLGIRDALTRVDERAYDAVGIRFTLSYTVLVQHASGGTAPHDASGDDVDLIGVWTPFRNDPRISGSLEVAFEGRNRYGKITPSALSATFDSQWATTSGFNEQDFSLIQAYWRQDLLADRLHVCIGKLSPYSTFFGNRINSSALFFVNYAFSDNPAVFMPGNGLGLHVRWAFDERWTLALGIQNANGIKTGIDPSTLRYGEFWAAVQLQRAVDLPGLGKGTWRVGSWYVTPREVADTGAGGGGVLSIDQERGPKAIAFLRYEVQGTNLLNPQVAYEVLTGTEQVIRGGFVFPGPIPAWRDDLIGIGGAWGLPASDGVGDSVVCEAFYRGQMESSTQLSFSVQLIESSTIYERVVVFSVRLRVEL